MQARNISSHPEHGIGRWTDEQILRAVTQGWAGLVAGSGRLRRRRLAITAEGRGIAGHRTAEVLLPQVSGMISDAPQRPAVHASAEPMRLLRPVRRAG